MIKANSNAVQYGIKHLVFDDNEQFKAYTGVAAAGSTAYIIATKKSYILDSQRTWHLLPVNSSSSSGGEDEEVIYIYDGGEI